MTDPRRRSRDAPDDEFNPTSRMVTPRRSLSTEDSYPDEEPIENEEEPNPTLSHSPPAIPPTVLSSPIVPTYDSPSSSRPPRCRADARKWDWMPEVLDKWRQTERIPILPEAPESHTPIHPLTLEPAHHTIPILITRLVTHEDRLDRLDQEMQDRADSPTGENELLHARVSDIENDLSELRDTTTTTHDNGVQTSDEVVALRQRVEQLEQELATTRDELGQLRTVAATTIRIVEILERVNERLR